MGIGAFATMKNEYLNITAHTQRAKHARYYLVALYTILRSCLTLQVTYFRFSFRFSRRAVVSYWRKYVHEELVNRLGGLSLPRKSVVRLTDRPDMTLDVYRGRKTTMQQQQQQDVSGTYVAMKPNFIRSSHRLQVLL